MASRNLTIQETNALKGIAILLMLVHHLFTGNQMDLYDDIFIGGHLVQNIGGFSKLCVAIFVFLSGYGLLIQAENKGGIGSLKSWYVHRFKKLFLNYWFIWIIFVPITVFCFGYTLKDAYQTEIGWQLLTDLLGVHNFFFESTQCYNPTWWFYSCIIVLYLLFPLLYTFVRKNALFVLLLAYAVSLLPISELCGVKDYLPSFVLGMCLGMVKNAPPQTNREGLKNLSWIVIVILFLLWSIVREFNSYRLIVDSVLTLILVLGYMNVEVPVKITKSLSFLGKHSMNIFLFHTFIYHFWFEKFVYVSRNPLVIFVTLLVICIPISMLLDYLKKYTLYKL